MNCFSHSYMLSYQLNSDVKFDGQNS